mgnify:FL=1
MVEDSSRGFCRGLYKQPGGKLVGVTIHRAAEHGKTRGTSLGMLHGTVREASRDSDAADHDDFLESCAIDGDFFLDGDENDAQRMLRDIERTLVVRTNTAMRALTAGTAMESRADDTHDAGAEDSHDHDALSADETARCSESRVDGNADGVDRMNHAGVSAAIADVMRRYPDARMVGMTPQGIATAFLRAVADMESPVQALRTEPVIEPLDRDRTRSYCGLTAEECANRWKALHARVVHDEPRMPEEQMAIDVAWARQVAAGEREPTLRIWEWAAPAVVIGRFQSLEHEVDARAARDGGFHIVRRCTGGGAMFIEPGNTITYSLYAPLEFVHGISIEDSYRLCDHWLVEALDGLGLDVRFSGLNDIATQYGKLGGAAQRRFAPRDGGPGAVLHHVTLAYDIDALKMSRVLRTSREKMSDKAVKSAVKRVDPMRSQTGMSRDAVVGALLAAARRVTI